MVVILFTDCFVKRAIQQTTQNEKAVKEEWRLKSRFRHVMRKFSDYLSYKKVIRRNWFFF